MNYRKAVVFFPLILAGCSHQIQPVIPSYFPDQESLIDSKVELSFGHGLEQLNGEIYNDSNKSCKAYTLTIDMQSEFKESVNRLFKSKFIGGKGSESYDIEISIEKFRPYFSDTNEDMRIWFGLLAGAPRINAGAEIDALVIVKKDGETLIQDTAKAKESEHFSYWTCEDASLAVKGMVERSSRKLLETIDKQSLSKLAQIKSKRSTVSDSGVVEKIKSLKKLFDDGLIGSSEYDSRKKKILDEL